VRVDGALRIFPQPKPAAERTAVVARSAKSRQLFQFVNVSATKYDLLWLERGDQSLDNILNKTTPLFLAMLL